MAILVTGATGVIGTEVTRQLVAAGERPRLLVRNPDKAKAFASSVQIVTGDLGDAEALRAALRDVDRLFLLATGPELPRLEQVAVSAAQQAGVRHIVKLSVAGAESEALSLARWHRQSEKNILASRIPYTFVRPVNFMSNALAWADTIRSQGAVYLPVGEGRVAHVDPVDVAAVAVRALLGGNAHQGKEYVVTGPEALSTADLVASISQAIDKPVRFVDVPADAFAQQMKAAGLPNALLTAYVELYAAMRADLLNFATPTVEMVAGRKPGRFADWASRHASAFR